MRGPYELLRPLLFSLDPEVAHRLALKALATGLHPRPAREHPRAEAAPARPRLPQSARHGRRFRQERRGAGRASVARLRLHRGRHGDAASPRGQSQATHLPADSAQGADQPARPSTATATRRSHRRLVARPNRAGIVGDQCRRQQQQRRPGRRLCRRGRPLRRSRRLFHHQHLVAQHAGSARFPSRARADRAAVAGLRGARRGRPQSAASPQDRARP